MVLELGITVTTGQGVEKGYGEGKFGVLKNILLVGVGLYGDCRIRLHVKSHQKKKKKKVINT